MSFYPPPSFAKETGLTSRAAKALWCIFGHRIPTIEEVAAIESKRTLYDYPNLGKGGVASIENWLARNGHSFAFSVMPSGPVTRAELLQALKEAVAAHEKETSDVLRWRAVIRRSDRYVTTDE